MKGKDKDRCPDCDGGLERVEGMECKECGDNIPLKNGTDNEPIEGTKYFLKVTNPEDESLVCKKEEFYCSKECLNKGGK